ncbi:MAG TPA: acyltransferase family protein [Bacillota bacterium]|nr:acyltransferase family protein [Bacillota bacterium]
MDEQMQTPIAKPKRQQYYAVDIAKFICAILVVAGHTFPLGTYSEAGDFLIIQGIARVVVPFFFLAAAYLFFSHYQPPLPKSWLSMALYRAYWYFVLFLEHYLL